MSSTAPLIMLSSCLRPQLQAHKQPTPKLTHTGSWQQNMLQLAAAHLPYRQHRPTTHIELVLAPTDAGKRLLQTATFKTNTHWQLAAKKLLQLAAAHLPDGKHRPTSHVELVLAATAAGTQTATHKTHTHWPAPLHISTRMFQLP
jgi:hypothetical protein